MLWEMYNLISYIYVQFNILYKVFVNQYHIWIEVKYIESLGVGHIVNIANIVNTMKFAILFVILRY